MAADQQQQQGQSQYNQIYTLGVQPGIKRDGTLFESREFSDGVWCRFQRGTPKKIGGYNIKLISTTKFGCRDTIISKIVIILNTE